MSQLALFVPFCVFISVCGYGLILHKKLLGKRKDLEYLIPGLGLSVVIVTGGFLNLFNSAGATSSRTIIFLGLFLFSWEAHTRKLFRKLLCKTRQPTLDLLFQFFATVFALYSYALGVLNRNFNLHDDFEGYFTFATKFNQLGTLGWDPFSERRLVTSVGGQSYIDSIFLSFIPNNYLHAPDLGFGFFALIVSVSLFLKSHKWNVKQISGVVILICLINPLTVNITSTYLLTLLCFLVLALATNRSAEKGLRFQVVMALLATSGMTLKNSSIPFILCVTLLYSLLRFRERYASTFPLRNHLPIYLFLVCFWFPWGLELYRSSGTFLYPLLGKGNHGSKYGTFSQSSDLMDFDFLKSLLAPIFYAPTSSILLTCTFILLAYLMISGEVSKFDRGIIVYVFCVLVLFYIAFTIATDGYAIYRYIFPALFAFFLYILHFLGRSKLRVLGTIVLISVVVSLAQLTFKGLGYSSITSRFSPIELQYSNVPSRQLYAEDIQDLLPRNSKVLIRTSFNYMFDFARNDLLIADYPGAASPPPGIPNFGSSEDMKNYLQKHEIEFVIFQYENFFEREDFSDRLSKDYNSWLRAEASNAFAFHDRMIELSEECQVVFDDNETFVLKLVS